jgi:lipopolysaccharide export system protein LptC
MTYRSTIMGVMMTLALTTAVIMSLTFHTSNLPKPDESRLPDGYMENVTAVILDKTGKISMQIVTPKMVHYAKDDTTDFTAPQLTLYHQSPTPWFITSKVAKAQHGIDQVHFHEDVVVHRPADFNNPVTVIKTVSLTVHPNDKTAETAEPIVMTQPNTVINAVGMFADLNTGSIKLLSQAKGEYEPDAS